MSDLPLPTRVEGVGAGWLTAALATRYSDITVTRAEVRDILSGTSTKIRVALEYDAAGRAAHLPATLIIKGGFEEHSPRMGPMYATEVRFYRDVQPHVTLNAPRCYFAGSDPASYQSIVILEDLVARDVRFCHAQIPQGFAAVARRLAALARLHADSWNDPGFAEGGRWRWVDSRFEHWSLSYADCYLEPEVWDHYMRLPRGAAVSVQLHDRERMGMALRRLGELEHEGPVCLIHGDTHLGNLYVDADGEPGFLDAQVARSCWATEIAYHVCCALDLADRRRWEEALLAGYLEALASHGVAAPNFAEAWTAYRRAIAYGLFIFLINESRFQTEAINTAYAARFGAAAIDHDIFALLV